MEIIDFERKGNVIRFYLGTNGEQWGDDWDDTPYECNAGTVYDKYVKGKRDIAFPFDCIVLEPEDGAWQRAGSNCCKEDMMNRRVPCIIVVPPELAKDSWYVDSFDHWIGCDGVKKYYFGDEMSDDLDIIEPLKEALKEHEGH